MYYLLIWCVEEIKKLRRALQALSATFYGQISTLRTQVASFTGGGGAVQQVYQYTNDPTSDGIVPTNVALPAIAYQKDGLGDTYTWNTVGQVWQ